MRDREQDIGLLWEYNYHNLQSQLGGAINCAAYKNLSAMWKKLALEPYILNTGYQNDWAWDASINKGLN